MIINAIKNVEEITVEELSEQTEIQINMVRKILYRFYNHSLVTSRRFRDKETGWFIFQWRLQPELIEAFVTGNQLLCRTHSGSSGDRRAVSIANWPRSSFAVTSARAVP